MTHFWNFRATIGRKIYAIIALSFACFIGVTMYEMNELGDTLREQKKIELTHLGELALTVVKEEHAAADKAGLSAAEAQKRAADRLRKLRYGNGDYFWIQDMHPRMVMHPTTPDFEGKDISDFKDAKGGRYTVAMSDMVKRNGSGIIEYEYARTGSPKPQPKMSFVTGYAPWGWVIGTGVYIDDLEAQTWKATKDALLITALVLLFVALIATLIARGIAKAMHAMTAAMRELAGGRLDVVLPGLGRKDEVGEIAAAVEAFKVKAVEKAQNEAREREERERLAAEEHRAVEERESAQKKAAEEKAAAERRAAMLALANSFEAAVGGIVEAVSSAATELEAAAATLTHTAETTQSLSTAVAAASEEASANVQSVASASGGDVARRWMRSAARCRNRAGLPVDAVSQAGADRRPHRRTLGQAAGAYRRRRQTDHGDRRADQPPGLERHHRGGARRRGRQGVRRRGSARSKALAAQTAKATGEIGAQIAGMQTATRGFGHGHQGNRRHHPDAFRRSPVRHRGGGGGAGVGDGGDHPQCPAGRPWHDRGRQEHRRRQPRRRRDRLGVVPGLVVGAFALA